VTLRDIQRKYLSLAYEFVANGVPVFAAKPVPPSGDRRSEFYLTPGWPNIDPDPKYLEKWRPGWAVCAVTGVKFDVVDVDPRHGGDLTYSILERVGALPPPLGRIETPSGGFHIYTHRSYLRKFVPWQGVDYQAGDKGASGRGFVYIPPTIRKGKGYKITQPMDWTGINSSYYYPPYDVFYKKLLENYTFSDRELNSYRVLEGERVFTAEELQETQDKAYAFAEIVGRTSVGYRDSMLNKYAYMLGGMVSGSGLDEQYAVNILALMVTDHWGLTQHELTSWAYPKIERGVDQGKAFPVDIFAFEEDSFGRSYDSED
jgi:hypothetical protein